MKSAGRCGNKDHNARFKRIYCSYFNCVCCGHSCWILFYSQMAAGFRIQDQYQLVDVPIGRSIGHYHCVVNTKLYGNKSSNREPREIVTN